jgi:hypothetical protein
MWGVSLNRSSSSSSRGLGRSRSIQERAAAAVEGADALDVQADTIATALSRMQLQVDWGFVWTT